MTRPFPVPSFLPPCGALPRADGTALFRVWAPHAGRVDLVLPGRDPLPLTPGERGHFSATIPGIAEGQRYWFRLDGGPRRPDPASRWQPDGADGPSAVLDAHAFPWTDPGWKGVPQAELALYELHVGTFTPEGTFDAVIPRLAELVDLGVTAVELMPVAEFPGGRNWGYDGVFPFAAQSSYGGPHGLMRLVDACHAAGLAVLLDVVYNHFGPEGCYQGEFGPYRTDRYQTPWGQAVNFDGPNSGPVRRYVLDNVRMWLDEFRLDGLRLDAAHAIYDLGARHILAEIAAVAREVEARQGREICVIAESDLNDPRLLHPPERYGLGIDAQWSDDFHHAVHALLTGEAHGYYSDYGDAEHLRHALETPFIYAGTYSPFRERHHGAPPDDLGGERFVVCVQNHDQVGNRATGDRFGTLLPPEKQRFAAAIMLLAPHLPMLFMGEEYGEANPFPFFCSFRDPALVEAVRQGRKREFEAFLAGGAVPDPQAEETFRSAVLSWDWSDPTRAGLRLLYRDLLAARKRWPALRDFSGHTARWADDRAGLLEFRRGAGWVAFANLGHDPRPMPDPGGPGLLFRSESPRYGGPGGDELRPWECAVFGVA